MTQVDFYIVDSDSEDARLKIACRIVDKANDSDQHVFIHALLGRRGEEARRAALDVLAGQLHPAQHRARGRGRGAAEPVIIGLNRGRLSDRWDLMINLAPDVPEFFSRYRRVAEVVDGNATRRAQSRDRYRFYRDRGYTLNTHQV